MHLKRWLTSIIGIPILIVLIIKGSLPIFALFISLVMVISLWEYYYIVFGGSKQEIASAIPLWGFLTGLLLIFSAYIGSFQLMLGVLLMNMIGAAMLSMPRFKNGQEILSIVARQIQGVFYIPVTLSAIILLRSGSNGAAWVFFLLFIVFAGDAGAFYTGSYLGRHKLSPSISPGKTIEGSVGGIFSSLVVGYLFKSFFLPDLHPVTSVILIIIVNIAAQAGDLFESALKRAGKIKDSGSILPGHGGLLDRIDALLFAAPVIYFCKEYWISGF
jgi:phosphatidate cytidylyltransferase